MNIERKIMAESAPEGVVGAPDQSVKTDTTGDLAQIGFADANRPPRPLFTAPLPPLADQAPVEARPDSGSPGGVEPPPPGDGRGRGPEGPRGPERTEWEMTPERGRWLVDEFLRYRLTMPYEVRYNAENGPRFKWLCEEIGKYVDAWIEIRNDPDPWGPHKAYPKPPEWLPGEDFKSPEFPPEDQALVDLNTAISTLHGQYILEGSEQASQPAEITLESLPTDSEGQLISASTFKAQYDEPSTPEELRIARAQLDVYFRQAKINGLLGEVDAELNNVYKDIAREGFSNDQINMVLNNGSIRARNAAIGELRDKILDGVDVGAFTGVANAYIDMAVRTLERYLRSQRQPERVEGEWSIPTSEQASRGRKETYWTTSSWPKYYQVTAENEAQFLVAKETFFQMIRTAGLGKSPDAVYEHVQNFIEAFKGAGGRQVQEGRISNEFLVDTRLELEALLFVFVGNYSNEVYNHTRRYEAMKAMSLDEGPARWVGIYRSGSGEVASFTEIFDMEALMDIYMNPVGERGELNIVAGHFLQDMIQEKVIERGMGIALKDYDFREEYLGSDSLEAKIHAARELERIIRDLDGFKAGARDGNLTLTEELRALKLEEGVIEIKNGRIRLKEGYTEESLLSRRDRDRLNSLKSNLKRLGLTNSREEFKALYEGFDQGDTHIKNYQHFKDYQRLEQEQNVAEESRQFSDLSKLPESIRRSIDLGRIQIEVQAIRQAIINREIIPPRGKRAVDMLKNPRDREIYKAAFDRAAANFDVAFQMQGVLGEKGRRGRGFLYADRNPHLRFYYEQWDRFRTEGRDINTTEVYEEMWKSLNNDQKKSFKIGWMLSKMRDGKLLGTFSNEWRDFYDKQVSPEDKDDFVDNIPVYQAENFVQWGVFWTKMKYADDQPVWNGRGDWENWTDPISQKIKEENKATKKGEFANFKAKYRRAKVVETRNRLTEQLRVKGYEAQLTSDELGSGGQPGIMTYKRPLGIIDSATGQFRKFKNGEFLGYNQAGQRIELAFNQDGKPIDLEFDQTGKAIIYDKARDEIDASGKVVAPRNLVVYDTLNAKTRARLHQASGIFVEEVAATFQFAALSDDFRNRYTDHTYWYYQGNTRDTILTDKVREAAERIMLGLSRPEDEDILATARLVVDPTGCRIRKFPDRHQQRETTLIAAAVLESFQDKQRTRHAIHRAFLPSDGFEGRMQAGYRNEDWAGYDRFTMGFEEFAAQQPLRLMRRGAAWIANVPMEHDAAGPRWGVHGVGGAVKAMADDIKDIAHQGIVSQFGLTKIFEVLHQAVRKFEAVVGYTDPKTGEHVFGLGEKPTDNNERLHKHYEDAIKGDLLSNPSKAIPFIYDFKEAFSRLQTLVHVMRVVDTDNDNSAGALNLEEVDVFLEDDSYNLEIETNKDIRQNNGTARARQYAFLYGEEGWVGFYNWLVSRKPGGGSDVYRRERFWNSMLKQKYRDFEAEEYSAEGLKTKPVEAGLLEVWLTEKII